MKHYTIIDEKLDLRGKTMSSNLHGMPLPTVDGGNNSNSHHTNFMGI